jgi:hypothetical protein
MRRKFRAHDRAHLVRFGFERGYLSTGPRPHSKGTAAWRLAGTHVAGCFARFGRTDCPCGRRAGDAV